jgi:hypothetical protein
VLLVLSPSLSKFTVPVQMASITPDTVKSLVRWAEGRRRTRYGSGRPIP